MGFVGRERELTRVATALERAAGGEIQRVCLLGPAGIGVTDLLSELERRLADVSDVVVARGSAHEPRSGVPYDALASALRYALRRLPDERLVEVVGPAGYDLSILLPDLAARLRALGAVPAEPLLAAPDQRGIRMAEAALGALRRLAARGVVLLALEELQWADPGTRSFVESLIRISRRLPVCLVVSYRPDEIHRRHPMRELADKLSGHPAVESITLEPLARQDLVRLLEGMLGEHPSGSFVAAVLEGSGGNPLMAKHLVAAHESVEGLRLSDPFDEILRARLGRLSPAALRCLHVLAAARRPLPRRQLLDVELPDGHLSTAGLAEALASGLAVTLESATQVVPDGGPPEHAVAIAHERFAEAIEELALPTQRQRAHAALAAALPELPAEEAWHREAAMDFPAARNAHLAAAEAAETVEPGGTALLHYQRALELLGTGQAGSSPLPVPESELLARAAQAAFVGGSFRLAVSLVQQAIAQRSAAAQGDAARRGDPSRRRLQLEIGLLHERLGRYRWASGDLVPALDAFETAVQLVPDDPTPERARVLGALAQQLMLEGRFAESIPLAEDARDAARAAGPAALAELGHAVCTLGVDVGYAGDPDRGLALLEEASAIARRAGRLDELMRTYANRTTLLYADLRREESLAVVNEGIREARRGGLEGVYGAFLRGNAAEALFQLGRWAEAEAECRAALEWSPSGVAWFSPIMYLGLVLVESRADEEASRTVGQLLLQVESVPEGQWTANVQRTACSLALWRDDLADAQRVAERGWQRVLQTDEWTQVAMAASTTLEVCAAVAERGRARRDWAAVAAAGQLGQGVVREAERRVARSEVPPTRGVRREAELHLGMARRHAARVKGRPDAAGWRTLAEEWSQIPVPYQAAKARWWEAAAALGEHERTEARDALVEAWRLAEALPARPLQRELVRLAQRGRIPLPAAAEAGAPERPLVAVGPGLPRDAVGVAAPWESATNGNGNGSARADQDASPSYDRAGARGPRRGIRERVVAVESGPATQPFGLSPRETEVLAVLSEGRTNREIAERLFISDRTVGVHVRKILAKLGVSGRVEAASVAIRLGLVPGVEQGVHSGR